MAIFSNISGTWKKVSKVFNNVSGTWKEAKALYANVSGTWKQLHSSAAAYTFSASVSKATSTKLADMFDAATIAANTNFVITVPAGITLATTTGVPVFDFSAVTGKNITIVNNGTIKAGTSPSASYYSCIYSAWASGYIPCTVNQGANAWMPLSSIVQNFSCHCDATGRADSIAWTLYSTAAGTAVQAIVNGSNTITVTGNGAQAGSTGATNYYSLSNYSCYDCGGTSG